VVRWPRATPNLRPALVPLPGDTERTAAKHRDENNKRASYSPTVPAMAMRVEPGGRKRVRIRDDRECGAATSVSAAVTRGARHGGNQTDGVDPVSWTLLSHGEGDEGRVVL